VCHTPPHLHKARVQRRSAVSCANPQLPLCAHSLPRPALKLLFKVWLFSFCKTVCRRFLFVDKGKPLGSRDVLPKLAQALLKQMNTSTTNYVNAFLWTCGYSCLCSLQHLISGSDVTQATQIHHTSVCCTPWPVQTQPPTGDLLFIHEKAQIFNITVDTSHPLHLVCKYTFHHPWRNFIT